METEELNSGKGFNLRLEARLCEYFLSTGVFSIEEEIFPEELRERALPSVTGEIEKQIGQMELSRDVDFVLSKLPYREEQILRAFFGIGTEKKDTLQLSQEYNISRQRISQIKNKALAKLRRHPFRKTLTPYLKNSLLREH